MRYYCTLFVCLFCSLTVASAQPSTMKATVSAGGIQSHIYVAVGQPFFQQVGSDDGNVEFDFGVAQAQLTRDTVYDVATFEATYTDNGFDLPAQSSSHRDSVYIVNGGVHHYDLLRTLLLIVCPQTVTDLVDAGISYSTVALSGHCWTKQNLRTPVAGAMTYSSAMNPTVDVEKYGLLYTWQTALDNVVPVDGDTVQGICPPNWYIPNADEINSLFTHDAPSLRSTEGWVNSIVNTNSTGFSAYPAGKYNSALSRFEGLGTETHWWSTVNPNPSTAITASEVITATALCSSYFCDVLLSKTHPTADALSVRCVMKNVWPE